VAATTSDGDAPHRSWKWNWTVAAVRCRAVDHGALVRLAQMVGPMRGMGPSIEIVEAVSESFHSASALAKALGLPVFEPASWPPDVGEIEYVLERFPGGDHPTGDHYRIGSTRHNDVPICVIAHRDVPRAGRAVGEWRAT
jgi:hypothetical protein